MGHAVGAKALHPAAFVIDADQQVRPLAFEIGAQFTELLAAFPVTGEQGDATGQRVLDAAAVVLAECQAGNIDDEGGVFGAHELNGWMKMLDHDKAGGEVGFVAYGNMG